MLGLDRRALQVAWTLLLFAAIAAVVYQARRTLAIFVLALFLAHLIAPVVDFVARFVPARVSRTAVLGIVYVVILAAVTLSAVSVGSRIAEQAAGLAARLPEAIQQDPLARLPMPDWLEPMRPKLTELIRARMDELGRQVLPFLSRAGVQILSGIGNLLSVILIPILSFLFLKDGDALQEAIVESFENGQRPLVRGIVSDLHVLLAQYVRALVILSFATFLFYLGFLSSTGVPYAILLSGIAAPLEFIPVVGPLVASVVILLVAAFTGYPHLLWIVGFLVVYRIFEDYVLSPYLMSAGVAIHPLAMLFGVLAGEQLAGIPGMFFSVPVIAALRIVVVRLRRRSHEE